MKELILWKPCEESEADGYATYGNGDCSPIKRVVIPILSDRELFSLSNKVVPSFFDKDMWRKGYRYKQEEINSDKTIKHE